MNETTKRFPRSLQEARPWEYPVIEHYEADNWHMGLAFSAVCLMLSVLLLVAVYAEWI